MNGFRFPWESMTAAAKAGYANRLVTYNAGIGETFLYTDHQDYWAGELVGLESPPPARFLPNGLQWHGWACLDDRAWVYGNNRATPRGTLYSDDELLAFLSLCRKHRAPMCFNVIVFQDGLPAEASIEQLRRVTEAMRGEA